VGTHVLVHSWAKEDQQWLRLHWKLTTPSATLW
jgi:hypothetical protein